MPRSCSSVKALAFTRTSKDGLLLARPASTWTSCWPKIDMKRSQVFIANVVKCRPPGNRDPLPEELEACRDYLERQIQAINPKVIVTLGRFSMANFLPNAKISSVHGQAMKVKGRLVIAMYHPAAALHQQSLKPTIEQDFARLPELIAQAEKAPAVEPEKSHRPGEKGAEAAQPVLTST